MREEILKIYNQFDNYQKFFGLLKSKNGSKYMSYISGETNFLNNFGVKDIIKIYYFINDIKEIKLCTCGKHLRFRTFRDGFYKTCGDKECVSIERKKTSMSIYGVDNPMKDESIRKKMTETMINRHGVMWAQQNKNIQEKTRNAYSNKTEEEKLEESSNRSASQKENWKDNREDILLKQTNTKIQKYGSLENYYEIVGEKISDFRKKMTTEKRKEWIDKTTKSNKEFYTKEIVEKLPPDVTYVDRYRTETDNDYILILNCGICKNDFEIHRGLIKSRKENNETTCIFCNPKKFGYSRSEKEVFNFIKLIYDECVIENHKVSNQELDIYIPNMKLGIEYNGLYWHSEKYKDKNFHIDKTKFFEKNDIRIFHIWEDQWIHKKEIIKSRLKYIFRKSDIKLYARKCSIKDVSESESKTFLEANHIQGSQIGSSYRIGLYNGGVLVSLMTFGSCRRNLGNKNEKNIYELYRFCTKLDHSVSGGASKILTHFINHIKPTKIISYSDNSYSTGNLYESLGFTKEGTSSPNYYWYNKNEIKRYNRFAFRKDKLVSAGYDSNVSEKDIMHSLGFYKIFDCGSQRWVYNNTIH